MQQTVTTVSYCNTFWVKIFPFLRWWPMVTRATAKADFMAGLTGAVVVLPQGVAFAMIAGLPPVYGLYTAMVPAIIAGLFGSSRHLISGPTTAISIVVFAAVSKFAEPGSAKFVQMALTLTFLAGVYQLALGLARMGALVNFISHSVVVGFTAGAAVLIATSQLRHYFGMHIPAGESFLHTWRDLIAQLPDTNLYVAGIATLTLASLIVLMRLKPRWPVMLIGMIIGSLVAAVLGGEGKDIRLVGELPSHLPPLSMPDLHLAALRQLGSAALAVAMLGLVEAVSIARSVASKSGQRVDGSQEFVGQGLANAVGSFFSSYASSGSFTRSGLNYTAGAVTPLSAVFAAVSLALIMLLVAPLAAHLPIAAMAAVLLVVAYRLIDFHHIKTIISTSKRETAVLATTFFATLFVELEFAIYVGVMLSLIIYLMRTAQPKVAVTVPDPNTQHRTFVSDENLPECPQLKVVRIDGSIYFGAVDHVGERLHSFAEANPAQKHLVVVGTGVNFIDLAGAELLAAEARRRRGQGGDLYLAKIKPEACETLRRGGFRDLIGADNIFPGKASAIANIFQRLDHSICARCDKRIFAECAQVRPISLGAAAPAVPELGTLPRIERLLVTSDDSEYTAGAIHEALRIAKKSGARVRVIHLIPRASNELTTGTEQIPEPLLARARTHLDSVEREAAAAGVVCDTEVIHTSLRLYQEIVNQADQMKADLIVMGRRGRRGLARVRLGQATAKVIGHAHCGVLVVPRNAEVTGQRLVLATDGSVYADAATAMAGSLAKILAAPVSALSVTLPSQSAQRHEEARVAANRAAAFLKNHELDAEAVVYHGRPDEVIVKTAIAKKADLIVIGSHGRTGIDRVMLGSVSERVIDATSTAVLVAKIS
ncbi:MAG: sulfate permease [Gammaproteobacteria bacterium]|nr:sulfate permease [Gammaproteobacteria bacterium]